MTNISVILFIVCVLSHFTFYYCFPHFQSASLWLNVPVFTRGEEFVLATGYFSNPLEINKSLLTIIRFKH